jgi:dCTP deaminase
MKLTILSTQTIRHYAQKGMITPFVDGKVVVNGTSYGLSASSYDVRIAHGLALFPGQAALAHTVEDFDMPHNVCAFVVDKSTFARRFMSAMNTLIDPGFRGNLTLELVNQGPETIVVNSGDPIAQIVFHFLDEPTEKPYSGKFQGQTKEAHGPRFEQPDGSWRRYAGF